MKYIFILIFGLALVSCNRSKVNYSLKCLQIRNYGENTPPFSSPYIEIHIGVSNFSNETVIIKNEHKNLFITHNKDTLFLGNKNYSNTFEISNGEEDAFFFGSNIDKTEWEIEKLTDLIKHGSFYMSNKLENPFIIERDSDFSEQCPIIEDIEDDW
ncbi:hypothetical protein [Nonlabens sp. Asnod2-A12]|uniref:hypothetical protein n=1 Tax=Nonlabens sp. Asnod2-A12 TaxID=3160578 RepID=UPI0038706CE0